jgi:DNA polymerase kappa
MHLDMDMFFAAVEIRDDPSLANVPMAVGSIAMISTSNYIARKYGVRSAMPGFIALKLCPQLKLIGGHFHRYKEESIKIMEILEEYDPFLESSGLDEAYVDLTDYCKTNKIYSKDEIIGMVKEIKKKIFEKTQLTCSCGIACNKRLAKICSDYNKPDGLYFLDFEPKVIEEFVEKLSIRKIPFIGSKTETRLNLLKIFTCKDLVERQVDLFYINEDSFDFYMKNCYGIGSYEHSEYQEEKSISRSESFFMTGNKEQLLNTLEKLKEKIFKDMEKSHVLYCKTLTIEIIGLSERKVSKCFTSKYGLPNKNSIKTKAIELFTELLEREKKARMIRIKISGLVKENENESKNGIISLLNNLKTDYKEGILPKKKMIISPSKKENFGINLSKNKCNSQTKSKEKNNRNGSKRSKSAVNKVKFKLNNKNKIKRNTSTKPNLFRDIVSLISNMKQEIKIN